MAEFPDLVAPWSRVPLVHDDTGLLPDETMQAIYEATAEAPEVSGAVAARDAAVAARDAAVAAEEGAEAARATAGTSAFNAGASAAAAQSSEDDAEAAQAAAESARDIAAGQASAASGAASDAASSAGTATVQAGLAEGHAEDAAASALAAEDALAQLELAGRFPVFSIDLDGGVDPVDKETYVSGTYAITLPDGTVPHQGGIRLRGRGNSTWGAPKKPWRVNFDVATAPLGMSATQRNWALLANHFDPSKLNNAFALQLGGRMSGLAWTPQERVVELVLNGTFRGLYQLADLVRLESGRVAGPEPSEEGDGSDGSWLLEISNKERPDPESGEWIETRRSFLRQDTQRCEPDGWPGWPAPPTFNGDGSFAIAPGQNAVTSGFADVFMPGVVAGGSYHLAVEKTAGTAYIGIVYKNAGGAWSAAEANAPGGVVSIPADALAAPGMRLRVSSGAGGPVTFSKPTLTVAADTGAPFTGDDADSDTIRYEWDGATASVQETRDAPSGDPGFATPVMDQWIFYDTPEAPTETQEAHIAGVIGAFETALQAGEWATVATLADLTSFADWWLLNEAIKNADSHFWSSCKLHVTAAGVITMGPLWDQDLSLGVTPDALLPATGWWTRTAAWLTRLCDDPTFMTLARARWTALLTELDAMGGLGWFDREAGRLTRAIRDDNTRWSQVTYVPLEVDRRKRWLAERIAWITTQLTP